MKVTKQQEVYICDAYRIHLYPMIKLAKEFNMTRQGIYKILTRNGIDTTRHKLTVSCSYCNQPIQRHRCQIRHNKHLFCDDDCYFAWLKAGNGLPYVQNRQGQRIARETVKQFFDLKPNHIVHHEDRNTLNNNPNNLKIFANQGDHIRWHRLGPDYVQPIWDGEIISKEPSG